MQISTPSGHLTPKEIFAVIRRRKVLLILPVVIVTTLSVVGALVMPRQYQSSTTLMVQREEILNPLLSYELAIRMADEEDRLRTFNEILYSQLTIRKLIDSLGIGKDVRSEAQLQDLITNIKGKITTERRGTDVFSITFTDPDPGLAQKSASLLSELFISAILQVETQRNELAVEFYEKKLKEIREKFEESQRKMIAGLKDRVGVLPRESQVIYSQLQNLDNQISAIDSKIDMYQKALTNLHGFPSAIRTDNGKEALYEISRSDVPFATDLRPLLSQYEDYIQRYTLRYPEVEKLETRILDLIDRMKTALRAELATLQPQRQNYEQRRADVAEELRQSTLNQRVSSDVDADYGTYKRLYDEMTVKLEQAQTARELGISGANRFVVIDPAIVPTRPSRPNRPQIVIGGFGLGIFLGILSVILAEMFDTTIRSQRDIEIYSKPIIAFIGDGTERSRR